MVGATAVVWQPAEGPASPPLHPFITMGHNWRSRSCKERRKVSHLAFGALQEWPAGQHAAA